MKVVKVPGKTKRNKIFIYALSTCAWCKMTKQFFKDNNVEFEYVDVDLSNDEDKDKKPQLPSHSNRRQDLDHGFPKR